MDNRTGQIAATIAAIAIGKWLIIDPCIRFLQRKDMFRGSMNTPFLTMHIRWRNIGMYLILCAVVFGIFWGIDSLLR